LQGVALIIGILVGLVAIPVVLVGQSLDRQIAVEGVHERLSAIQTELGKANEIALSSAVAKKPQRAEFDRQMSIVAEKVAAVAAADEVDTTTLGRVNAGLVTYASQINSALAAETAQPGSGTTALTQAQATWTSTLDDLGMLLAAVPTEPQRPLAPLVFAWVALSVGLIVLVWISFVLAGRFKRVFNAGVSAAIVLTIVAGAGLVFATNPPDLPSYEATHRIVAVEGELLRARSAELVAVVDPSDEQARADADAHLLNARDHGRGEYASLLGDYPQAWQTVKGHLEKGETTAAATAAMGASHTALQEAQTALAEEASRLRSKASDVMRSTGQMLFWIGIGTGLVGVATALTGMNGLQRRLREYR
jgi:hypothetical protein